MAKVRSKSSAKKKKNWIPIYGSNNFEGLYIGESLGEKPADIVGRVIEVSLGDIMKDMKKQNTKLLFKVNAIKENRAIADVVGYMVMSSYLRRSVIKMKSKVNDSFKCKTKDGISVQLKPLLMTRSSTQKSVLSSIREKARGVLNSEVSKLGYYELIDNIVANRLQRMLREKIKKVYPLSACEIRVLERL